MHLVQILLILLRCGRAEADGIAEVVGRKAGMIVSRSMMHSPLPVSSSNRMLFSFVSLWVTRRGSAPSSCWRTSTPQSFCLASTKPISGWQDAARFFRSRFSATWNASNRLTVLWKSGIVS